MKTIPKTAYIGGLMLIYCVGSLVHAQKTMTYKQHPDINFEAKPLCKFPEELTPDWYSIESPTLVIHALPPDKRDQTDQAAGLLTFRVEFKEIKERVCGKRLEFSCRHFGPLFSMFLDDNRFIATGCTSSHTDYIYIAETERLDQGIGITCRSPRISPTGRYVFFSAQIARSIQPWEGSCYLLIDLLERRPSAYRVYPLPDKTAEVLPLHLQEPDIQWFWPPDDMIFNCRDAVSGAHSPASSPQWSPDGLKIAFIDQSIIRSVEFQISYDFVVLDFSQGLIVPQILTLPIDFEKNITPERKGTVYAVPTIQIKWVENNVLEAKFRSGDPKLLLKKRFRLNLGDNIKNKGEKSGFFDLARATD